MCPKLGPLTLLLLPLLPILEQLNHVTQANCWSYFAAFLVRHVSILTVALVRPSRPRCHTTVLRGPRCNRQRNDPTAATKCRRPTETSTQIRQATNSKIIIASKSQQGNHSTTTKTLFITQQKEHCYNYKFC